MGDYEDYQNNQNAYDVNPDTFEGFEDTSYPDDDYDMYQLDDSYSCYA